MILMCGVVYLDVSLTASVLQTASYAFFCETFWGLRVPILLGFIDAGTSQRINATVQSCYSTQPTARINTSAARRRRAAIAQ